MLKVEIIRTQYTVWLQVCCGNMNCPDAFISFDLVLRVRMEVLFARWPLELQVCCFLQKQVKEGRLNVNGLE